MDAREFWEIVKKEHRKRMPGCETKKYGICPFFIGGQCTAGVWSTGIKDPVAIAEQIKVKRDKPQLPKKTLITFVEKWQYGIKDYFELLFESQNAIIDYLKAREK